MFFFHKIMENLCFFSAQCDQFLHIMTCYDKYYQTVRNERTTLRQCQICLCLLQQKRNRESKRCFCFLLTVFISSPCGTHRLVYFVVVLNLQLVLLQISRFFLSIFNSHLLHLDTFLLFPSSLLPLSFLFFFLLFLHFVRYQMHPH